MGDPALTTNPNNHSMCRFPASAARVRFLTALFLGALLVGQAAYWAPPAAAEAQPRVVTIWNPGKVTGQTIAGTCPTATDPNATCPLERGVTYLTSVQLSFATATESQLINVQGNGLDIQAVSATTNQAYTPPLAAGQSDTINLRITIPEADGHNDRSFYLGRIYLIGSQPVVGQLLVSLVVPRLRLTWGRVLDETGERAPIETVIGSGSIVRRTVTVTSSLNASDLQVRANTDRMTIENVASVASAGVAQNATLTFDAPTVNRRTRFDVVLHARNGLELLEASLRIRFVVLPVEVRWNPPQIREALSVQTQQFREVTVTLTSNYDISGIRFRTADLGLTPILSPLTTVDLRANVPQPVRLRLCPGYAPTTYFVGITAYQGAKPLNRRLPINMLVADDGTGIPTVPPVDPCTQTP